MQGSWVRRILALAFVAVLIGLVVYQVADQPRDAGAVTTTLTPVADATVDQSQPTAKLGTKSQLIVDGSPVNQTFVRFDLSKVKPPIGTAALRLHVDDISNGGSPTGGSLATSSNTTWAESSVTWNPRPTIDGAPITTLGPVAQNTWVTIDVTGLVAARAGGKVTFALTSTNTDGAYYDSRETKSTAPQLVVNTGTTSTTSTTSTSIPSSSTSTSTSATTSTTTTTTSAPLPTSTTFAPTADTYVEDATATTNYGTAPQLTVDASPNREVLLRFDLTSVTGPVQRARLRLHVANISNGGTPDGGAVSRVNDAAWTETGATWNNRPTAWATAVGSFGAIAQNTWVEVDVTAAITAGATNTLGLRSSNTDGAYYDSRETGASAPQLVVTMGTASPPVTGVVVGAVGDTACPPAYAPTSATCRQMAVSDRIVADSDLTWLLALGDLQYENGELADFQGAYDPSYGRVKAKTKPVPGNHEYNNSGANGYFTYFGAAAGDPNRGYYSFDVGSTWHIVALNSNCDVMTCAGGSAQEQWLRTDLAASGRPCTIAFWHHPRFSSATHGDDATVAPFWTALADAGAEIVLSGHDHGYERFEPQTPTAAASPTGIREFVVGTGGRSLYPFGAPHANSAVRISGFGYLRLTLGANAYSWQFVTETGAISDSGTGTCH